MTVRTHKPFPERYFQLLYNIHYFTVYLLIKITNHDFSCPPVTKQISIRVKQYILDIYLFSNILIELVFKYYFR